MPQAPSAGTRPSPRAATRAPSAARTGGPVPRGGARVPPRPPAGPRGRGPRPGAPDRRVAAVLVLVLVVGVVFTGRLLQVQTLDSAALARQALGNRLVSVTLPAQRGEITDRDGDVLAASVERYDVTADPSLFEKTAEHPKVKTAAQAAALLAPVLGQSVAALTAVLTPRGTTRYAVVARSVTPATWARVAALHVPGIYRERHDVRTYPAGSVAGTLVGYLGADGTALGGLEYSEDSVLTGADGHESYERGKDGTRIPMGESTHRAARNGADVRLTIDDDLQYAAQQAIDAQTTATGAEWGTVVAMKPDGEVLALAQSGEMDPNDPSATPVADRRDVALQDVVEPGSTGKVITAAAAIEEGLVTPATKLSVPPSLSIPHAGKPIVDAETHGVEQLTFSGVIAQSSNIGTVMVGRQLTRQQRYDYLRAFGIGSKQLGLPGESAGILARPADWDGRQQYTVLFGQGYAVTTLQAAQVYATIANGGVRVTPHLVAGTTDSSGTYHPAAVAKGTRVVSEATSKQVIGMLESVVTSEGTGNNASVAGFRVAGKTGTAQAVDPDGGYTKNQFTSSFIGMAPADDPQIVIAVTLQHPQTNHFGGTVAAPVFSQVMSYALAQQHVAPTGTTADPTPLTW